MSCPKCEVFIPCYDCQKAIRSKYSESGGCTRWKYDYNNLCELQCEICLVKLPNEKEGE